MSRGDPQWSEPKRVRTSVVIGGAHVGYVTTVDYPNRGLTAFPEGTPHFEVVVSDPHDRHVGLLQRFKRHWLIHCGDRCGTVETEKPLTADEITRLAAFALEHASDGPDWLLAALAVRLEEMLGPPAGG